MAAQSGATVRTGAMVRELARTARPDGEGWRLTVGPTRAPEWLDADAVILAVPARPASRLLAAAAGAAAAAAALGEIEYASMAIVTLAYRAGAFPARPEGSGYLVPAVDGRAVKAVTFSTVKWPHLRAGRTPAWRSSGARSGRIGEEALLQRDDAELAGLAAADLAAATGVRGEPADVRVSRWGGALPQYTVGHLERVRAHPRLGRRPSPGSRSAGRSTTGSAYRPASRPRGSPPTRCSPTSDRGSPGPPMSASGRWDNEGHDWERARPEARPRSGPRRGT